MPTSTRYGPIKQKDGADVGIGPILDVYERLLILQAGNAGQRRQRKHTIFRFDENHQNSHCMLHFLFPTKAIRFCGGPGITPSLLVLQTSNAGQF